MDSTLSHDPFAPEDGREPESWERQLSGEPVLDYDKANAKNVAAFVSHAPLDVAERVLAYEQTHQQRKEALKAAEARVFLLVTPPHENPDTVAALRSAIGKKHIDNYAKEKPPMFQKDRLLRAGATDDEANLLEAEYLNSDPEAQKSLDDHLASISEGDIREWLDQLRESGRFSDEPVSEETPAAESDGEQSDETAEQIAAREQAEVEAKAAAEKTAADEATAAEAAKAQGAPGHRQR